jgi:hypothetical protein
MDEADDDAETGAHGARVGMDEGKIADRRLKREAERAYGQQVAPPVRTEEDEALNPTGTAARKTLKALAKAKRRSGRAVLDAVARGEEPNPDDVTLATSSTSGLVASVGGLPRAAGRHPHAQDEAEEEEEKLPTRRPAASSASYDFSEFF